MDRTKLACFSLLASAFVLAALLIVRLPAILPVAQATMVDDQDRFTVMTVQTRATQESLFVIDQANEKLLVYDLDATPRSHLVKTAVQALKASPVKLRDLASDAVAGARAL